MGYHLSYRLKLVILYLVISRYRSGIRFRKFLPCFALGSFDDSAWMSILNSSHDLAMIEFCGVNRSGFHYLARRFAAHAYFSTERRKCIGPTHILALTLSYMRSRGQQYTLQAMFNISAAAVSRYLHSGMEILIDILRTDTFGCIRWPRPSEMLRYSKMIEERFPHLPNCFGFVDGFRLFIQDFSVPNEQNAYYNQKYLSNVANLLVSAPDGTIIFYSTNYPGSWHDSAVAKDLYDRLQNPAKTPDPYRIIADQAFRSLNGKILKTQKINVSDVQIEACSARQAIEWGVRTVRANWPRLQNFLSTDREKNRKLILLSLLLTNFKTRWVGINQTRTFFESRY